MWSSRNDNKTTDIGRQRIAFSKKDEYSCRLKPLGTSCYLRLFNEYRVSARKKEQAFGLDIDDFKAIVTQKCFYCGEIPRIRQRKRTLLVPANGIDRIDPNQGYLKHNIVPACKACNLMKKRKSLDEFLRLIGRIYERHRSFFTNNS